MEIYKEILESVLKNQDVHVLFPNLTIDATEIVQSECYNILKKIKAILEDDSLEDAECFMKIEEIIHVFERNNIAIQNRHDFI